MGTVCNTSKTVFETCNTFEGQTVLNAFYGVFRV